MKVLIQRLSSNKADWFSAVTVTLKAASCFYRDQILKVDSSSHSDVTLLFCFCTCCNSKRVKSYITRTWYKRSGRSLSDQNEANINVLNILWLMSRSCVSKSISLQTVLGHEDPMKSQSHGFIACPIESTLNDLLLRIPQQVK